MDSPSARTNRGTTSQLVVEMVQAALREVDVLPEQASALKTEAVSPEPCRASYLKPNDVKQFWMVESPRSAHALGRRQRRAVIGFSLRFLEDLDLA